MPTSELTESLSFWESVESPSFFAGTSICIVKVVIMWHQKSLQTYTNSRCVQKYSPFQVQVEIAMYSLKSTTVSSPPHYIFFLLFFSLVELWQVL